jgi:hypothetical protein
MVFPSVSNPKNAFIRQEFKKIHRPSAMRQNSHTKANTAQQQRLLASSVYLGKCG